MFITRRITVDLDGSLVKRARKRGPELNAYWKTIRIGYYRNATKESPLNDMYVHIPCMSGAPWSNGEYLTAIGNSANTVTDTILHGSCQ